MLKQRTWRSRRILRLSAVVAMLTTLLGPAAGPALADHQTRDGMYEENWYISVQFAYQFQWEAPWEADLDAVEVVPGAYDRIVVRNEETGAELEAVGAVGAEPASVLDSVVESRVGDLGAEVIDQDEGDGFVSATVAYEGEDGPVEEYLESGLAVGMEGNPDGALTIMVRAPEGELDATLEDVQETFVRDLGILGPMLVGVPAGSQSTGRDRDDDPTLEADEDETPESGGDDAGVDGNTYESPTYGYTLEWDEDLWTVDEERTASEDRDVLYLDYTDGGFLIVEGYEDYDGDPEDCLEGSSAEILESGEVDDVAPLEDEVGDVIEGDDDDVFFAAYTLEIGPDTAVAYFDCRTLVEDEAVLAFSLLVPEEAVEDAVDAFLDVRDSLELADQGDGRDDDETPEPEDETPAARGGDSYVSDEYGWSVEWDPRDWAMGDAPGRDDDYELRLNSDLSTIDFTVYDDYAGDAAACMDDQANRIETGTFEDFKVIEEPDGDDELSSAVYFVSFENSDGELVEVQTYLECRILVPGETVLSIFLITAPEDYDDEIELAQEVLDTIEVPEARAA